MGTELVDRVRARLAGTGAGTEPRMLADAVRAETDGIPGDLDVLDALKSLRHELVGAGPLEELLGSPDITDVLVTAPDEVWIDGPDGLRRTEVRFPGEDSVRRLAQRLALAAGRRLDDAQPFVDGWLRGQGPYGRVRLHAVLPPIAAGGTCLSLRILRPASHDLHSLQGLGVVDTAGLALLEAIVSARLAFFVSGATGSGKSTLLAALLGAVAPAERIVCVEDVGELSPAHPQFVGLLTRPPNVEGSGEVTSRDLVKEALRMRPDRLIVGEIRGREVIELLTALNTGHEGGAATLHANAPSEVPARLEALAALGGMSGAALHSQLAAAVQLVLHMRREPGRGRVLSEIAMVRRESGAVTVEPVWRPGERLTRDAPLSTLLRSRTSPDGRTDGVTC